MARRNWLSLAAAALVGCSSGAPDPSAPANAPALSASASKTAPSTVAASATSAVQAVTSTERPFDQYRAPGHDELAWAGRVAAAASQAEAEGRGVVVLDGRMIDAPFVQRARQLLQASRGVNP